jgi:hypothetical protein
MPICRARHFEEIEKKKNTEEQLDSFGGLEWKRVKFRGHVKIRILVEVCGLWRKRGGNGREEKGNGKGKETYKMMRPKEEGRIGEEEGSTFWPKEH